VGPETKRALEQFQKNNGLDRTARLDQQTMVALFN
jgi:peptidoglycan hydrolase-like protein with peptidoglycan-binding domain